MVDYLIVSVPLIGLLTNILIQIYLARYIKRLGLIRSVVAGFVLGLAVVILSQAGLDSAFSLLVMHCLSYISLAYCYFHFINLGETARRIRILREIKDNNDFISLEELLQNYNAKQIIKLRIDRLLKNKQITLRDGKFYIGNPMVLFMARVLVGFKIMLLGRSEEDYPRKNQ